MKAPKRSKLTSTMKGQPDYSNAEVLTQMATEVWNANQNTLVAHWIKENPGVPADEITLVHWTDSEGVHFKVKREPKAEVAE
jgi:hypothetical protein